MSWWLPGPWDEGRGTLLRGLTPLQHDVLMAALGASFPRLVLTWQRLGGLGARELLGSWGGSQQLQAEGQCVGADGVPWAAGGAVAGGAPWTWAGGGTGGGGRGCCPHSAQRCAWEQLLAVGGGQM